MTSHRGLLILVGLAPALVAMAACQKAEQQTRQPPPDTSTTVPDTMMMSDTSHVTMADTSRTLDHKPPPKHAKPPPKHAKPPPKHAKGDHEGPASVDTAVAQLSSGQVRYEGPDTMVVDSTVPVVVKLARATQFSPAVPHPHEQVLTAPTKMGDSASVCLDGGAVDFQIRPPLCRTQVVTSDTNNVWSWLVTPLRAGQKVLQVHVEALLANMPHKAVFDSTYFVTVTVAPRSFIDRVKEALATWQVILAAVAAVLGSAVLISKNLRALIASIFRRRGPPTGGGDDGG